MDAKNVYYINVKPYQCNIPFNDMAERYYQFNSHKILDKQKFVKFISNQMNYYDLNKSDIRNKSSAEIKDDLENSKEIHYHIRKFLKLNKKALTRRKKKKRKNNITLKIKHI